jgi:hypothetical protein
MNCEIHLDLWMEISHENITWSGFLRKSFTTFLCATKLNHLQLFKQHSGIFRMLLQGV